MRKRIRLLTKFVCLVVTGTLALSLVGCTNGELEKKTKKENTNKYASTPKAENPGAEPTRFSVHDPSIIRANENGEYYIIGTHTASAKSVDLMTWDQMSTGYDTPKDTPIFGNLDTTFQRPFQWAGHDLAEDSEFDYAIWASDISWNPYYKWDDGSKGAYMLFCSTDTTWCRACISYLVSKTMDGTFEYVDTVMYSGFTTTGKPDFEGDINTKWDQDTLNLKELVDKGAKNGGIDAISEKWFDKLGFWNREYSPLAIDPNIFFDAKNEHMYMSYGSWLGGIYMLELDRETGKPIYPGVDYVDEKTGNYVDRYFGTHIAGGNRQSGEGPYIQYDKESKYYYLYETYGGLTASGGYNMRLFRSKKPQGPYLDIMGKNAADSGKESNCDEYGIKVMGNYQFDNQRGVRSPGHCSVLMEEDNLRYLVYHERFETKDESEAHEVRIHQQFLNEDNWPVTAVYEYRGENISTYQKNEVVGTYEFINHGKGSTGEMLDTSEIQLNEDGSISGDVSGTWEKKAKSDNQYDYITITIGKTIYKGYFYQQTKESEEGAAPVMTFAAIGDDNTTIWGSMK